MKVLRLVMLLPLLMCAAASGSAQQLGKLIDDGAGPYAQELVRLHAASAENLMRKKDTEPFAISFFGWRALTIVRLPFNSYEGAQLNISRLALNIYDNELDITLQPLTTRATQLTQFVEASKAEQAAVQKFVVQKYGGKYVFNFEAIEAGKKLDEVATWKYNLGAVLGELAGSVIKWYAFPNYPKYDEAIAGYLRNLDKKIQEAPTGASQELLTSLRQLAAFGRKNLFSQMEREQLGAAIKQTLMTTLSFAKPLSQAPSHSAYSATNPSGKPRVPPPTNSADSKAIAEQYRQQGLAKVNNKLYDAAIADFDRAAAADAQNPAIYSSRGQAQLAKGDADKAIADFTRAIELGGITQNDYYHLNDRARAHIKKSSYAAALADLNQAIALYAKNAYGYYLRGFVHRLLGNDAQARADLQASLALNPNFQPAKDELAKLQ